jgi:DNA gyrase subunit A
MLAKETVPVNIEDEMRQSYLDYAMSVIVGRALPDVRDGLKPVHRRALFAMHELNNDWNKPYKKSARIVGDVIGKYHPHGDSAVYDTIVRMAQPFSLRYMLVDGQGNFGSIDGDAPAAMRYTEIRMSRLAHELLADIEKETVDFTPNYDGSEQEPAILPTRVPNLLINGSSGIAVGMATNIPPHNLREIINACLFLIDQPDCEIYDLMKHVPGPDFPTAGIVNGTRGIREAYATGRGRVVMRARYEIETYDNGKQAIIVTELPYQVNKARLVEKIAELVKEKKIDGITELRDESDKDGMRMFVGLRRGENAEVVLNNLYSQTPMQNTFSINMVCLIDGQPRLLNLKQMLEAFLRHRREVVTRRTLFELRKARQRAHLLEGLTVALANIDEMITLIKAAPTPSEAKTSLLSKSWKADLIQELLSRHAKPEDARPADLPLNVGLNDDFYQLSEEQAQAILELRLHRLTGLEKDKIFNEYQDLLQKIVELLRILRDPDRLMEVIREELIAIREQYQDDRRTEIRQDSQDLNMEDLIDQEDMVVTLSHTGYAKAQPLTEYRAQRRGGKGKIATQIKDEDFIDKLLIANSHDTILCFSSRGKVYWLKVYELPQAGRTARGKPINNLLPLETDERITAILPVSEYSEDKFIFMATLRGTVKKTSLIEFSRPRSNGIIALDLAENDQLIGVALTDGNREVLLFSSDGKAMRFHENQVRAMGRTARGVRGIDLNENSHLVSLIIAEPDGTILTATVNGFGKRTPIDDYPVKVHRGGQGVITIKTNDRNGDVIGAVQVKDNNDVMLISNLGTLVRTPVKGISVVGRNTQGVNLIRLSGEEKLVGLERIEDIDETTDEIQDAQTDEILPETPVVPISEEGNNENT